jgi:AcrB/AcrD/AcrF family
VTAPLERRLGEIPGVIALTSTSSLGTASISVQFDISRKIDSAARDVQAALNAAVADLPGDLPNLPNFRKANPNATPILILALTSDTRPAPAPGRATGAPRCRRGRPAPRGGTSGDCGKLRSCGYGQRHVWFNSYPSLPQQPGGYPYDPGTV